MPDHPIAFPGSLGGIPEALLGRLQFKLPDTPSQAPLPARGWWGRAGRVLPDTPSQAPLPANSNWKPPKATLPDTPSQAPLPAGRHDLRLPEGREAVLVVPEGLDGQSPVPLLVLCHGAGGAADKVLPFFERWVQDKRFLLLAPQSMFPTWDIVIAGHGPDLERLGNALQQVAACFRLDPARLALAGFSDGGSYALAVGLTNGDLFSHVIALSAGFMDTFVRHGAPKVLIAHGRADSQLPFDASARKHAIKLLKEGVDLTLLPFDGDHVILPDVAARAVAFFMGENTTQPDAQSV